MLLSRSDISLISIPQESGSLALSRQSADGPWQRALDRVIMRNTDTALRYRNARQDIFASSEVVREVVPNLISRLGQDPTMAQQLSEVRTFSRPDDVPWVEAQIVGALNQMVEKLARSVPTPFELLPEVKSLLQCSLRDLRPSTEFLKEVVEGLITSGIELSSLHRDAHALGFPIPYAGSAPSFRLKLAHGLAEMFELEIDSRFLEQALESKDFRLFEKIAAMTGYEHLAKRNLSIQWGEKKISFKDWPEDDARTSVRTMREVLEGLAHHGDVEGLSKIHKMIPPEQFVINAESTSLLYEHVCSKAEFGVNALGSASSEFCRLTVMLPVPENVLTRHLERACKNYLDPVQGGYFVDPRFGSLIRMRRLEAFIGIPSDLSDANLRLQCLVAPIAGELTSTPPIPSEHTLSLAISYHLERVNTSTEFKVLLSRIATIAQDGVVSVALPFEALLRAAKRAHITPIAAEEAYFSLCPKISSEACLQMYRTAFHYADTVEEFLDWAEAIEERSGVPLTPELFCAVSGASQEEKQGEEISQRVFEMGVATLSGNGADRVKAIVELESKLGVQFSVNEASAPLAYAQILSPRFRLSDSFQYRRESWKECANAYKFIRDRSGVPAQNDLVQRTFSFLFSSEAIRAADISSFSQIVGIAMEEETIDTAYRSVVWRFCTNESPIDADTILDEIELATGRPLQLTEEQLHAFCDLAHMSLDRPGKRIALLCARVGGVPTSAFLEKYVFSAPFFEASLKIPVPRQELDAHFSRSEIFSLWEFARMYRVFRCYDYYQERLARIKDRNDTEALRERIFVYGAILANEDKDSEVSKSAREELLKIFDYERDELTTDLKQAIAYMVQAGHVDILLEATGPEVPRYKFHVIIDPYFANFTSDCSKLLWNVLATGANKRQGFVPIMLRTVLPRLSEDIMSAEVSASLLQACNKEELHDLRDIRYLDLARSIQALELRAQSQAIIAREIIRAGQEKRSLSILGDQYPYIPEDSFIQIGLLTDWDPLLLEQFNILYRNNRNPSHAESLCFVITHATKLPTSTLEALRAILRRESNLGESDAQIVSQMIGALSYPALGIVNYDETAIKFDRETILATSSSLKEARERLRTQVGQELAYYSPRLKVTDPDLIRANLSHWEAAAPLITYLSQLISHARDEVLPLMGEIISHIDAPHYERWKEWRYNGERTGIPDQLQGLDEHQKAIWIDDKIVHAGTVDLGFGSREKGARVLRCIEEILSDKAETGAIYPEGAAETLRRTLQTLAESSPQEREWIIRTTGQKYQRIITHLDTAIKIQRVPLIDQCVAMLGERAEVRLNAKTRGFLHAVGVFLPAEQRDEIKNRFNECKARAGSVPLSDLISATALETLVAERSRLLRRAELPEQQDMLKKFGISGTSTQILQQCHRLSRKYGAIGRMIDLAAQAAALADGTSEDEVAEKRLQKKMITTVANLIRFHRGSAAAQELDNIEQILRMPDSSRNGSVFMLWTDNPAILLQIGKYPVGCSSCKNFEGSVDTNVSVVADMADAHIKVALLIDFEKLPPEAQELIRSGDPSTAARGLRASDVHKASIARAIVKKTSLPTGAPALFLEDIYSNYGSEAVAALFQRFICNELAGPMGALPSHEGNAFEVEVPASRSAAGQYEDRHRLSRPSLRMGIKKDSYKMKADLIPTEASKETAVYTGGRAERKGEVVRTPYRRAAWIEQQFDLKTLVIDAKSASLDNGIETAGRLAGCHMVALTKYSNKQREQFLSKGFLEVPQRVGYELVLPTHIDGKGSFEEAYLALFSSESRRKRRRDFQRISAGIEAGEFTLVFDRSGSEMERFLALYEREMESKARGRKPLSYAIQDRGGSPVRFLRDGRLGVFLKQGDTMLAGIIASRARSGYSIDYQASDSSVRTELRDMSAFLVSRLLERGFSEGDTRAYFGSDTNLYGHHLTVGLLRSKVQLGFQPYARGFEKRLVKIVDSTPLADPFCFYSLDAQGGLCSNVCFRDPPATSAVSLFTRAAASLKVWQATRSGLLVFEGKETLASLDAASFA